MASRLSGGSACCWVMGLANWRVMRLQKGSMPSFRRGHANMGWISVVTTAFNQ